MTKRALVKPEMMPKRLLRKPIIGGYAGRKYARSLTDTQQDDFVLRLPNRRPPNREYLFASIHYADAGPLADLLVALLKKANWNVGFGTPASGWAKTVLVCVGTNPPLNITSAATAIVETLRQDGIMAFINEKLGPTILLTDQATSKEPRHDNNCRLEAVIPIKGVKYIIPLFCGPRQRPVAPGRRQYRKPNAQYTDRNKW